MGSPLEQLRDEALCHVQHRGVRFSGSLQESNPCSHPKCAAEPSVFVGNSARLHAVWTVAMSFATHLAVSV